jgi:fibro-slime domain-containing protein
MIATEQCDDGNTVSSDGCSSNCLVEPGATCSGTPSTCTLAECGNGIAEAGESCDEGNCTTGSTLCNGLFLGDGSGCSKTCTQEPVCRSGTGTVTTRACDTSCGNGNIETGETCDDGNLNSGDGCSETCTVEGGFTCSVQNTPDTEPCTQSGGSGECLQLPMIYRDFKSERESAGHPDFFYMGATVASPVSISGVNNGTTVNFNRRYCVPNSGGPAKQNDSTPRCWSLATANLNPQGKPVFDTSRNGGGANATLCECQFTDWSHDTNGNHVPGYSMTNSPLNGLPYYSGGTAQGHPQYVGRAPIVTSGTTFAQWWVDSSFTGNTHMVQTLELASIGTGLYRFSSAPHSIYGGFFPIDPPANAFPLYSPTGSTTGPGAVRTSTTGNNEPLLCNLWPYWFSTTSFGAGNNCRGDQYLFPPSVDATTYPNGTWITPIQGWFHNSWFSTESRYLFNFNGAFSLQFFGDDDMFIYINGVLVVDLGGVHQRLPGRVDVAANGTATIIEGGSVNPTTNQINACPGVDPYTMQTTNATCAGGTCDCRTRTVSLGLQTGRTYEIAIFGADRHPTESNYQLTLSGFSTSRSNCTPRCGDGVVTGSEECDCGDGTQTSQSPECGGVTNNDTEYGGCTTTCRYGPYCGDGVVNGTEQCDEGTAANTVTYGNSTGCSPGCQNPHFCGDGILDAGWGEGCDLGGNNGMQGQPCDAMCDVVEDVF